MRDERREALVVLGMHRSGMSAIARVLSLAGAALPDQIAGPTDGNWLGRWEPAGVHRLNDKVLSELDSGWSDVVGLRRNRRGQIPSNPYRAEAAEIVAQSWPNQPMIVFKEPRSSLLVDLWADALTTNGFRSSYVIMVRNPLEIADSLKRRDGLTRDHSLLLWAKYMLSAEIATRRSPRVFVSFRTLLADPLSVLDRIEAELDIDIPIRTYAAAENIENFIKQEEKHHQHAEEFSLKRLPILDKYYAYLRSAAAGEAWNEDCSAELADWMDGLDQAVGPLIKTAQRVTRQSRDDLAAARREADEMRAQAETVAAELEDIRSKAEALTAGVSAAEAARAATVAELENVSAQHAEALGASEARGAALGADVARLSDESHALRAHNEGLGVQLQQTQAHAASLDRQLSATEAARAATVAEFAVAVARHAEALSASEGRGAALDIEVARLQEESKALRAEAKALEGELVASRAAADKLAERLATFQSTTEARATGLRIRIQDLERAKVAATEALVHESARKRELERVLHSREISHNEQRVAYIAARQTIATRDIQLDQMRDTLAHAQASTEDLTGQLECFDKALRTTQAKQAEAEEAWQRQRDELNIQVAKLRERAEAAQNEAQRSEMTLRHSADMISTLSEALIIQADLERYPTRALLAELGRRLGMGRRSRGRSH